MSNQVLWSKIILETFIDEANLTKTEEIVMRLRVAGWTRQQTCDKLNMSMRSLDSTIAKLKVKYDAAQKHSIILPPRKTSSKELYMDSH